MTRARVGDRVQVLRNRGIDGWEELPGRIEAKVTNWLRSGWPVWYSVRIARTGRVYQVRRWDFRVVK